MNKAYLVILYVSLLAGLEFPDLCFFEPEYNLPQPNTPIMKSSGIIGPKGMNHVPSNNKQKMTISHSLSIDLSSLLLKCHQRAATGMTGISQAMIALTTIIDWQPRYMKRQTPENRSLEFISTAAEASQNII